MIKTKHIVITLCVAVSIAIMAMMPDKASSGAPASHTGAPGEGTCATGGCHDDNKINSGAANLSIDLGQITHYIPGKTYPIKVRIAEGSVIRFGFELVALVNSDTSNAGSLHLSDAYRTQLTKNQYSMLNRQYVTYSYDGTDAVSTGLGEWVVNWKAPLSNVGPITFYASGVSADDDETDKGDYVYTTSKVLSSQAVTMEQ